MKAAAIPKGWALGLKFTRANGETDGRDGRPVFTWPLTPGATVTAPDWRPDATCGGGLHFWPDGVGDVETCDYHATAAHGLVIAYPPKESVAFDGKAKVARAKVIFAGTPREAATWLAARRPGQPVIYAAITGGDDSTLTGGNYSTLTGGDDSTLTGGNYSTLTGGYRSTLTGGDGSTLTGGDGSALVAKWWDGARYRRRCVEVDGVTIKANTPYRLNAAGEFVEVVK